MKSKTDRWVRVPLESGFMPGDPEPLGIRLAPNGSPVRECRVTLAAVYF
jgi:hypothetical protein